MQQIMTGGATDAQIGSFLVGLRMKSESIEEITGAAQVMRELMTPVQVGDLLILSGKLGTLPGTMQLAPGGIKGETRQVLENIKASLEHHGAAMEDVVKCTVMLADIAEWPAFNEVYVTYFPGPKPARSAFGASGLALNGRVELECWAEMPSGE